MGSNTAKLKTNSSVSSAAKRSKSANGKSIAKKKPINEIWIEKYGVDDSKAAKALMLAWQKTFESHQKNKRLD